MLELVAVFITLGAMLYHVFHLSVVTVSFVTAGFFTLSLLGVRSKKSFIAVLLLCASLMLGAVTVWSREEVVPAAFFGKRAFDAKVVSVDARLAKTVVIVRDTAFKKKVQLSVTGTTDAEPGDTVTVRAAIEAPEDFETNSGRMFGYKEYMESKKIFGTANNAEIIITEKGGFSIVKAATIIRQKFADAFSKYITFPFDGVVAGMTVGYQGGLPQDIQDLFRTTGVLHVLVLSGYNITLLAGFLALLLRRVPFRLRTGITIAAIIFLVLVSGSGVASIRAGIMGSIALFGALSSRTYAPLRALFLSYLFFFFLSPLTIFADPGFHLSMLATFFMIVVLPKFESLFHFIPKTNVIDVRELLMLALTVPIFMLPYTMYFSGLVPLASIPANILFAVITPAIMLSCVVLFCLSWIAPIAQLLGIVMSWFGRISLLFLTVLNKLPAWNAPEVSGVVVFGIYAVLLCILFRKEIRTYLKYYFAASAK